MTLKLAYASISIALILVLATLLLIKAPTSVSTDCKDFDGFCPPGCDFVIDADCPKQQMIQPGALFSCLVDTDCIPVYAICNNEDCVYFNNKCRYGQTCFVAINKIYINVWTDTDVTCIGEKLPLNCPNQTMLQPRCIKGTCQFT
ncbi:MAG: hypothetical protein QW063_02800 [Candidatus Nanoarchaeia archaeon]